MPKKVVLYIFLLLTYNVLKAQDTLSLSMQGTDSVFLKKNLSLLVQRYKVDADKALVRQARLWDNPTLSTEWNLYNPSKNKFFDVGAQGEKIIALEQVITIAGKRNKRVELAKANAQFTEFEFYDLMRTLKMDLRNNFQIIYFNTATIKKYDEQLGLLLTIINALQVQSDKGNIPLKEVLRLKAVYYQLNNDRTDLVTELYDAQKELQTLLQTTAYIEPVLSGPEISKYSLTRINPDSLVNRALQNRPDLKMVESLAKQADLNYSLQKRLAYPDLRIGGIYDQAGSYINNYTGISFGFDLPVWNRNQGNIKYAKAISQGMTLQLQNKNIEVTNDVISMYKKVQQVEQEYKKVDADFGKTFEQINDGFITNFQKRNISMIEFVDFFEAYNASILQLNKLNEKRIRSYEELNYIVGEELFKN